MKTNLRITKNTLSLVAREALNKGALFILLILIARIMGKEALGKYTLAFVISQIFYVGTELGLNTLMVREVAKNRSLVNKFIISVGTIRLILGVITMGFIWITALVIGAKGEAAHCILLCGLSYFFIGIVNLGGAVFRAFEKMELELFVVFVKNLMFLPLSVWALLRGGDLILIFGIFLVSNILTMIIAGICVVRQIGIPKFEHDISFLKYQIKQTIPLWVSQIFGIGYLKIAPLLLFKVKGSGAVGLYNAGLVVVDGFWVLAACFASSLFPVISRLTTETFSEARRQYLNGLKLMISVFLPIGAIIILTTPWLIKLFYGGNFIEIIPLFRLLIVVAVFVALDTLNGFSIIAVGKQRALPFITGTALLLNLFLNALLIPVYSYVGSAYALIASEILVFALKMMILKKYLLATGVAGVKGQ